MAKIDPEVLQKLREAKSLSQAQLAERAKVNVQTIWRLENGQQHDTRPSTITKLARALNVEPAVLTGDAPIPAMAPVPQKSSSNIRLRRQADNALHLVAQRYFVQPWQVMELAPLLFCWAAELSLRQRRDRLRKIEHACEAARALEREMRHLPVPNFTYSEEKIVAEAGSIDSHDIFGMCIDENDFLDDSFYPSPDDTENPFAVFLANVVDDLGDVATFEGFSPIDYPIYRVCPDEALQLVDGDKARAEEILDGSAVLSEMPKELYGLFGNSKERAEWVRAQAEGYRKEFVSRSEILERRKEVST